MYLLLLNWQHGRTDCFVLCAWLCVFVVVCGCVCVHAQVHTCVSDPVLWSRPCYLWKCTQLLNELLCLSLSTCSIQLYSIPPFLALFLVRAHTLTTCPLCVLSYRLPDVWVNETERSGLKTKVVHLSQLPQDTAMLLDPNIYRWVCVCNEAIGLFVHVHTLLQLHFVSAKHMLSMCKYF